MNIVNAVIRFTVVLISRLFGKLIILILSELELHGLTFIDLPDQKLDRYHPVRIG